MTRVSSFGHNQVMLSQLLENQSRLFDGQKQINTGKKTDEFRGLTREAETLLGAKSLKTRTETYLNTIADVKRKLDTNNVYLETIRSAGEDLRQVVIETLGQDQALAFSESLEQAVATALTALNAQVGGVYIFAGQRTDTKPVDADTLADLVAAPSAASLFQNDTNHLKARVNDNVEIRHGVLASEVAQDLLTSLKAIADFDAGAGGPLDGPLTAAQRTFLEGEMANLTAAVDKVQSFVAQNGLRQQRADSIEQELLGTSDFLDVFISDIEDVDLAKAITKVNSDQAALEASYRIVSQLSRLSILDFL
ncbi:MAG: hypothetical protein D6763_07950 [Alphaproteobacteria bacterium]|nr:MAG: hypothetical protein D6763_07950 [Alphaproteobacteria bacterium]